MVIGKNDRKIKLNSVYFKTVLKFLKYLQKLSNSGRKFYMKNIKNKEIKILSEVILNFLHCNIKHNINSVLHLKRVKKYIYLLASKKISYSKKKNILQSLKGLSILNIILPLAINTLAG